MTFEQFAADDKTIDAVARNFEIIGEAANRLSDEFKSGHPEIDWDRIRGFRNRIVHDYFGIDLAIVWNIAQNFLPKLAIDLSQIK
ncbi:MAG: HepT-like ribonuclease domain-containing protein [Pyrinomonadaceae bacterium]